MWLRPWHAMIGIAIIAVLFGSAGFVAYLLYGPGIAVVVPDVFGRTSTTSEEIEPASPGLPSIPVISLDDEPGRLFLCEGDRALKAEFTGDTARLALSDGRVLVLPQAVSEAGEVSYENTDGSFVFRNRENAVFVEEDDIVSYADCIAAE